MFSCEEDVPGPDEDLIEVTNYCGSFVIDIVDIESGGEGCPGDTLFITRTYYIEDDLSSDSCVQVIKVVDDVPPTFVCHNLSVGMFIQVFKPLLFLMMFLLR